MTKLTNFGGNVNFTPANPYEPRCEDEFMAIFSKQASGMCILVGSLHAWCPAVKFEDAIVSMQHFCDVRIEHHANGDVWATVGGGCRIKDLLRKLHALADVTIPSI